MIDFVDRENTFLVSSVKESEKMPMNEYGEIIRRENKELLQKVEEDNATRLDLKAIVEKIANLISMRHDALSLSVDSNNTDNEVKDDACIKENGDEK